MPQRSFLSNLSFLLLLNLLIKPLHIFAIDRNVQLIVGTADYGLYFALTNFAVIFNILLDFGLTNYNQRTVAQDPDVLPRLFPNLLFSKAILAILYTFVTLVVSYFVGYDRSAKHLLLFVIITNILLSFDKYLRSNISALQHFRADAVLSVTSRLTTICICSVLLWGNILPNFKIIHFVLAEIAGYLATMFVAVAYLRPRVVTAAAHFSPSDMLPTIRQGAPYALMVLLMSLYYRLDGFMLERLLPDNGIQAGIYAAAFRLLDAVNMFAVLFAGILIPLLASLLSKKKPVEQLTQQSSQLILAAAIALAIGCNAYQLPIMTLLYPQVATEYWAQLFGLLMFSFIPIATVYTYGSLLTAHARLRRINQIAFGGFALNLALNFALIPRYQAHGAAIATLLTQIGVGIAHLRVVHLEFRFKTWGFLFTKLTAFTGLTYFISILLYQKTGNWMLEFLLFGAFSLVLMFAFRLIPTDGFADGLSKKRFS